MKEQEWSKPNCLSLALTPCCRQLLELGCLLWLVAHTLSLSPQSQSFWLLATITLWTLIRFCILLKLKIDVNQPLIMFIVLETQLSCCCCCSSHHLTTSSKAWVGNLCFQRFLRVMRGTQGALIAASAVQIILGFSGLWRLVVRFQYSTTIFSFVFSLSRYDFKDHIDVNLL